MSKRRTVRPRGGDPLLDEREKLPRYHAASIPEIWVVSPQTWLWREPLPSTLRCLGSLLD